MKNLILPILFLPIFVYSQCDPVDGCNNGYSVYTYNEDSKYEGNWLNGRQTGQGVYTTTDYKYDGEWLDGRWEGQGVYTDNEGSKYEGGWVNDRQNGQGVYTTVDYKYDGKWLDGRWHGQGICTFNEGNFKSGEWIKDKLFYGVSCFYSNEEGLEGLEIKHIYKKGNVVDTLNNSLNYFNINDVIGDSISNKIKLINRKTKYDIILNINNVPVKLRFDTGAETTSISIDVWEKIKTKINFEDLKIIQKSTGVGGESTGKLLKLKDGIEIGDYTVNNFIIKIANNKHSLLGTDFLQKFSNVEWNMKEAHLVIYK